MQKAPSDNIRCFFMFFSASPHLHVRIHSPWFYVTIMWKYVTICNISSLRAAMFFPVKNIYLACGAYALMFALRWAVIFTTLLPDLMIINIAWGRRPFLLGASSRKCRVLFHQVSRITSISTSLVIFTFGIFLRC